MIGKNAGNCLYNQRKYFDKVLQLRKPQEKLVRREACNFYSEFDEDIHEKTVKEKHRQEMSNRKLAQCYMQSAWSDYEFFKSLKTNNDLSKSNQSAKSFDIINREIDDCVEQTKLMIVIAESFYSLW